VDTNWLASAYALKGDTESAAAELAEARRLKGQGFVFQHRQGEGRPVLERSITEDPRLVGNHLYSRPAQGGGAGGMTETRRLAAILGADVAGYSRLVGVNAGFAAHRRR
jgi:hypothetical protein